MTGLLHKHQFVVKQILFEANFKKDIQNFIS